MKRELNREEFDVLVGLSGTKLAEGTEKSLAYRKLVQESYIDSGKLTDNGLEALEPYRAKRAILLAAGMGTRLRPITLNTPKPLIRIHGKRLIDGLIDAFLMAGIDEIYIVRGYLGEQFDQLLFKYPMLHFIDNPFYETENNISSAMLVRHLLQNTYITDADLWIKNPEIISPYCFTSNCLGIEKEKTDDWCFTVKDDVIRDWGVGGRNCYQQIGISYWNAEDGKRLEKHIEHSYEQPGGKGEFWDQVALTDFRDEYQIHIRECQSADVMEIDSFSELVEIDAQYRI